LSSDSWYNSTIGPGWLRQTRWLVDIALLHKIVFQDHHS
jgi:hypothetical protein